MSKTPSDATFCPKCVAAEIYAGSNPTGKMIVRLCQLHAAAPDLLEALRNVTTLAYGSAGWLFAIDRARAAIKAAEGS